MAYRGTVSVVVRSWIRGSLRGMGFEKSAQTGKKRQLKAVPKQHIRPRPRTISEMWAIPKIDAGSDNRVRARASTAQTGQASSEKVSAHLMMQGAPALFCGLEGPDRRIARGIAAAIWPVDADHFRTGCDRCGAHLTPVDASECRQGVRLRPSRTTQPRLRSFSPCRYMRTSIRSRPESGGSLNADFAPGRPPAARSTTGPVASWRTSSSGGGSDPRPRRARSCVDAGWQSSRNWE
jgi:hypothetical protein